jgi:hypothetical protein
VLVLCELSELVRLIDREETNLREFLKAKVQAAVLDKNPLYFPLS